MAGKLDSTGIAEWKAHWPLVLSAMLGVSLCPLHIYSLGMFMAPMEQAFGWSRATVSAGLAIASFVNAFGSMIAGFLADRFGPRRVAIPGAMLFCSAFALLGLSSGSIPQWYATWLLISIGLPLINVSIWSSAVAGRFTASRGLALSVTLAGTGITSALAPIIAAFVLEAYGWRAAYVALPAIWAAVLLPVTLLFFHGAQDKRHAGRAEQAEARRALPGLDVRTALRSSRFWRIAIACFTFSFSVLALMVHFVPIVTEGGLDLVTASATAGLLGISSIVGRISTGYLLDRFHGPYIGLISFCVPVIAIAALLAHDGSALSAAIAAILLGFSLGGELDVIAYLVARYFGLRNYGTLFGTVVGLSSFGTATGPLAASMVHDATHSYGHFLLLYAPLFLLGALLIAFLGRYPDPDSLSSANDGVSDATQQP